MMSENLLVLVAATVAFCFLATCIKSLVEAWAAYDMHKAQIKVAKKSGAL